LTFERLQEYANATEEHLGISKVWGYIDGTHRPVARPVDRRLQSILYSGYTKCCCIKFQSVVTPDGMIRSLAGPFPGSTGDMRMVADSGLGDKLVELMGELPAEDLLYLYGDSAYVDGWGIIGAFKGKLINHIMRDPEQRVFDREMAALQVAVEHGFGLVTKYWSFGSFRNSMKAGLSPIGSYYIVSVLLTNCLSCFWGNQMADVYSMGTPDIRDYLEA
jgi:hypothetical protein